MAAPKKRNKIASGCASPRSPRRVTFAVRQAKAMKMRGEGATWQAIADECGYASAGSACAAVGRGVAAAANESAKPLRSIENNKLAKLERILWAQIEGEGVEPHGPSIDRVLKVMERRARLNGLDMPIGEAGDPSSPKQAIVFVLSGGGGATEQPGAAAAGGVSGDAPSA